MHAFSDYIMASVMASNKPLITSEAIYAPHPGSISKAFTGFQFMLLLSVGSLALPDPRPDYPRELDRSLEIISFRECAYNL